MKARPTIFLSGVSDEFRSFRDAIENEIEMKGCFAENQPGFPPDYVSVEEMLRRKLADADAVIHIVGFRFGAEPNQRPAGVPRRSYTQMEFDITRELQKPVYVFISQDATVRQLPFAEERPEDVEAVQLQLDHRAAVTKTNHLYYFFGSKAELCKLAAEIPPVQAADFHADISRIIKYAPAELIGRGDELKLLNDAWAKVRRAESPRPHILTFVALGGEGKTSLVAKWVAELAHQDWPGCDAAFAWSFYSQGTREQLAASSDLFLKEALTFFGDEAMAGSAAGAFEKGRRLAKLVGERRALLILDGLEPLQYAPTSPTPGELKDQGVAALLKGLAAASHGLCVVTTRYSLPDLKAFWQTTAPEVKLLRLSRDAGVHLLKSLGVKGSELRNLSLKGGEPDSEKVNEFEKLVEDVEGHALTLTLLGSYLKRAFHGDIRQRDRVKFEKADEKMDGGHAFRTMSAYEQWLLRDGGDEGRREVAVLRLMGLFDRPADAGCLSALRSKAISGITKELAGLADDDWEFCLSGLESAKLLTVNRDAAGALLSLDAHPLIREYFANRLRAKNLVGWRSAHRCLYEHLCVTTPDKPQPTLEDLQPLYQAVSHGCHAGLDQEVLLQLCEPRIWRWHEHYTTRRLGAFGSDLATLACFFDRPWSRITKLTGQDRAFVLSSAAASLCALGRLNEAIEPKQVAMQMSASLSTWDNAGADAQALADLHLTLGNLEQATVFAEKAVEFTKLGSNAMSQVHARTGVATVLHSFGRRAQAKTVFCEAEQVMAQVHPACPMLHSVGGFDYCELLLEDAEKAAWQRVLEKASSPHAGTHMATCRDVAHRATKSLGWGLEAGGSLLSIGLERLSLGRVRLYEAVLSETAVDDGVVQIIGALACLRHAGQQDELPHALITRAWLRFLTGACVGPESAQADLDEAWEIAERGPMKLFQADIHIYRARLFFREKQYPWESPAADLAAAEKLINTCGYHRRDEELADAKRAILGA